MKGNYQYVLSVKHPSGVILQINGEIVPALVESKDQSYIKEHLGSAFKMIVKALRKKK